MTNSRTTTVTLNGDLSSTNVLHPRGGGSGTVNGAISGIGANAIQKSDPATWTLGRRTRSAGRVAVGGGTLKIGSLAALNPAIPLAITGGNLDLNGFTVTNGGLALSGGAVSNGTLYATGPNAISGGALLVPLSGPAGVD